jgi:enamine deaminase RidA (YjgF/YER057c/UK114 family)
MTITHLNPESLLQNPVFTQAITVTAPATMVFVGGQNGVGADGQVVGKDLGSQTEQAYRNLLTAFNAAGATQEDVVKLGVYLAQGQSIDAGLAAAQSVLGDHPTTVTVLVVSGFALPDALVEIDAIAAVQPED